MVPYAPEHVEAVRQFNSRLGAVPEYREFVFPEVPPGAGEECEPGRREAFIALDGESVRGGYLLIDRSFSFRGRIETVTHCRLPVSEGVLDRAYSAVGVQLMRDAAARRPLLFTLGMGGLDNPLPRLLRTLGWSLSAVPFYFQALHPARCLRQLRAFRSTALRRALSTAAAATGLGWLGLKAAQARPIGRRAPCAEIVAEFGDWADAIWADCAPRYALIAERGARTLNLLYPPASDRFLRIHVADVPGWVVALDTQMDGHRHFGDLRVGTIADCLARPEHAAPAIQAATRVLADRGVDLIISNQAHAAWGAALRRAGFLPGPSNFAFAAAKPLAKELAPFDETCREIHLNRGDGDGPINL